MAYQDDELEQQAMQARAQQAILQKNAQGIPVPQITAPTETVTVNGGVPPIDTAPISVNSTLQEKPVNTESILPQLGTIDLRPLQQSNALHAAEDYARDESTKTPDMVGPGNSGLSNLSISARKIHNPLLRIPAQMGLGLVRGLEGVGNVLAPEVMAQIPGTEEHHDWQGIRSRQTVSQLQQEEAAELKNRQSAADATLTEAQPELKQAAIDVNLQKAANQLSQKEQQLAQNYAKIGYAPQLDATGQVVRDEQGNPVYVEDPNSQAYRARENKILLDQAKKDSQDSLQELQEAKAALARAQNDPHSPAYKLALERVQNATVRNNIYQQRLVQTQQQINARLYGTDLHGNVLPGASIIHDANGHEQAIGTAFQGQAAKNQSKAASFNDFYGAVKQYDNSLKNMFASGQGWSPAMRVAVREHGNTLSTWLNSEAARTLTPQQRQVLADLGNAKEQVVGLRSSVGGGVSDSQVNRLVSQIPGPETPDYDLAHRKIGTLTNSAGRLATGVNTVKGGLKVEVPSNVQASPQTHVFNLNKWAAANPGKDREAARRAAIAQGYKVIE